MRFFVFRCFVPIFIFLASTAGLRADALSDLAKFSAFSEVALDKLAGGKIMASRGPSLDGARDLAIETCFVVKAPLGRVIEAQKQWNATQHAELKVYLHTDLAGKPSLGAFDRVAAAPDNSAVRALVSATEKLPGGGGLQLSAAEAQSFKQGAPGAKGSGALPPAVDAFWSNLLYHRSAAMAESGLAKQPPYAAGSQTIRIAEEANRLLKEQPKLRGQFHSLIEQSALGSGSLPPSLYWELFDVEGEAAFSLGGAYIKQTADGGQALDLQYYASGGYYVLLTFYQMWPITLEGKPATLVWRGDSISSAALAELHGVEKMGSGSAMMKEIQKSVRLFQKDVR